MTASRNLVIGVGNIDRGDDAVGLMVARQIKQTGSHGVTVVEAGGDGAALLELWKDADTVIVIDAAHTKDKPGTMFRFDARASPIPTQSFHSSTHAFGLAEGIELSRVLNQLPDRLIVYGIVGENFALGSSPSPCILAAAQELTHLVLRDLANTKSSGGMARDCT